MLSLSWKQTDSKLMFSFFSTALYQFLHSSGNLSLNKKAGSNRLPVHLFPSAGIWHPLLKQVFCDSLDLKTVAGWGKILDVPSSVAWISHFNTEEPPTLHLKPWPRESLLVRFHRSVGGVSNKPAAELICLCCRWFSAWRWGYIHLSTESFN